MRAFVIVVVLLWSATAFAQQAQRTFNLQVTESDLVVIGRALEALPYRDAAPVLGRLQQQVNDQVKPPETPKDAEK